MLLRVCCLFLVFRAALSATISMVDDKMFTTDAYGDKTTLLYSGQYIMIECLCDGCSDDHLVVDEKGGTFGVGLDTISVVLNSTFLGGKYFCKDKRSTATSAGYIDPSYMLCEEGSDICNKLECSNKGEQNHFCVMDINDQSPKSCQMLPNTCGFTDAKKFGQNEVGVACEIGHEYDQFLCHMLADSSKTVMYICSQDTCQFSKKDIEIEVPALKKKVNLGFIGRLENSLEFKCKSDECKLDCTEKLPSKKMISEQKSVTKTFALSSSLVTAVTKITCAAKDYHTYLYNVRINSDVKITKVSGENYKCNFVNEADGVGGQINRTLKVTFSGNSLGAEFAAKDCGVYTCEGTTKIRNCNPFFEASEVGKTTLEMKDNCKRKGDDEPTTPTTAAGTSVHKILFSGFSIFFNVLLFAVFVKCFLF